MPTTTQEFILALKEQDKIDFIKTLILQFAPAMSTADAAKLANITISGPVNLDTMLTTLASKVDEVAGKGLSEEDFTTTLMNKLATMEGSHFKGVHADVAALELAHPAVGAEGGSYAYIHDGVNPEQLAILDDAGDLWVAQTQSGSTPLTGVQIKALYEAVADTNVFDDNAVSTLASALQSHQDISGKVDIVVDKDLSTNDYTDADQLLVGSALQSHQDITGLLKNDGSVIMDAAYVPTDPKGLVTLESIIMVKGTITAINDITTAGIYDGINLPDSPITGSVIIEVYADTAGNLDISLKGADGERHEGGRPNGGAVFWHNVTPDHLYGTTDPDPSLGKDGDIYFRIATP